MLFKNASIYRLTQSFDSNTDSLQDQLLQRSFTPCSGFRPSSFGWVPPISGVEGAPLFHEVAGCILLCARREDKVIPPSALNEAIAERVERVESLEGRKLRSKERMSIKDEALAELMPRALAKSKQILGYISPVTICWLSIRRMRQKLNCLLTAFENLSARLILYHPRLNQTPVKPLTSGS